MQRYWWAVKVPAAGGGWEPGGFGFEDDRQLAVDQAKSQAARLREEGAAGWFVGVMDTTKPILSINPPTLSWDLVYLDQG